MPRKTAVKKTVAQRTFRLPASLLSAFDAVCEQFDEDANRVARRLFEDGLRKVAREHSLSAVLEHLGEAKANPFDALAPMYTYAPQPVVYEPYVARVEQLPPIPTGDLVLPSGGPPIPVQRDDG